MADFAASLSVDLYGPGKVSESSCIWGAPAPGDTTPSATGCGLLAMPSAVACPPPHAVEVPSNSNALLGVGQVQHVFLAGHRARRLAIERARDKRTREETLTLH